MGSSVVMVMVVALLSFEGFASLEESEGFKLGWGAVFAGASGGDAWVRAARGDTA